MILEANIFQPIIDVFESVIKFFANDIGLSWGLSIVLLTFCVRALILPLSLKQIRSMRAMQALAPKLKEIQEKYKDDKERQQREMMTFYKEHGINPLASCWPLLLQLPVFIALYGLLRGSSFQADVQSTVDAGTNTVSFLFVNNILVKGGCSSVDACNTSSSVPLAPPVNSTAILVILIVLFLVTQLGAGLVMSARVEGNQRLLMFIFPLIIAPFIITQPAGLAIYWIATNVWTLGQQWVVQKVVPAPEKTTPEEEKRAKAPPPPPRKRKRRK